MIDLSDVILDPEMGCATLIARRREQVVDASSGFVSTSDVDYPIAGAVTVGPDNTMFRGPDYDALPKEIVVHTPFRLRGAAALFGKTYKPDLVLIGDSTFEVWTVNDWSRFGAGFVAATCRSVTPVDAPPGLPQDQTP